MERPEVDWPWESLDLSTRIPLVAVSISQLCFFMHAGFLLSGWLSPHGRKQVYKQLILTTNCMTREERELSLPNHSRNNPRERFWLAGHGPISMAKKGEPIAWRGSHVPSMTTSKADPLLQERNESRRWWHSWRGLWPRESPQPPFSFFIEV